PREAREGAGAQADPHHPRRRLRAAARVMTTTLTPADPSRDTPAPRFFHRLAVRLSLWYGGVLAVSSLLAFAVFYVVLATAIRQRTDPSLLTHAKETADELANGGVPAALDVLRREVAAAGTNDSFFRAWDASTGNPLATSDLGSWSDVVAALRPPLQTQ